MIETVWNIDRFLTERLDTYIGDPSLELNVSWSSLLRLMDLAQAEALDYPRRMA